MQLALLIARVEHAQEWGSACHEFNATGDVQKTLLHDTSLRPGEPAEIAIIAAERARWRLRYHYGSAEDEQRGLLPMEALVVTIASGEI